MNKFTLIAGPCAIEDNDTAFLIASKVNELCKALGVRYIFKGSYKKANRSRLNSFSGIGDQKALDVLSTIHNELHIDTITDVHETKDIAHVKNHVQHLQIPAFLCRQTELLLAAGKSGLGVNIKKGQFMSAEAMKFALEKVYSTGNKNAWLTERGNSFGYNDLVVDATSIYKMKQHGAPVFMDCTHAVQKPNQNSGITGGDPSTIEAIALSAIATGADGFFIETHPNPSTAKSDPHTMLKLDLLEEILVKCLRVKEALGGINQE